MRAERRQNGSDATLIHLCIHLVPSCRSSTLWMSPLQPLNGNGDRNNKEGWDHQSNINSAWFYFVQIVKPTFLVRSFWGQQLLFNGQNLILKEWSPHGSRSSLIWDWIGSCMFTITGISVYMGPAVWYCSTTRPAWTNRFLISTSCWCETCPV